MKFSSIILFILIFSGCSSISNEAHDFNQKYWESVFSPCDGKYYTIYEPAQKNDNLQRILEMEKMRYQASRFRTDGGEWAGVGYFYAGHSLMYKDGKWGKMNDAVYGLESNDGAIIFVKKNGQWQVEEVRGKFTPISCSEVPSS